MTSSTTTAASEPTAGLAHLLASRRARAHEAAAAEEGTTARQTGGALALAAAAAKRSRPTKSRRQIAAPTAPSSPSPKAAPSQDLPHIVAVPRQQPDNAARSMVATRERGSQASTRVTPRLRWQCQHFLLTNLRRARLSQDAIDPWADVEACRARPMGCADVDVVYCRTAEEAAYAETDGRPAAYEACIRRIAYALRSGGRVVMANHPADTLAALDDDVLSACTAPGRRRLRERTRLDECRTMMSDAGVFEDAAAAVVRCRRCGGSDITTSLLQTRGADEPMTVFSQCANPKCGARWRQ
ncbi:TFIIS C-domain containing protein [Pandoravirus macleodensis]|uniref:TFIIS C-domain containing protein n=1 Tax=Pandoravirus macleodensis TaxID=2107707 RepID=A0A2U7UF28_9VIRU|nr:TFIIS C-domain containing protein [Pandoravirus macleodensis]AVK77079.1 TFIIS C-domain containing protein [Pandoravirus macleodensis]